MHRRFRTAGGLMDIEAYILIGGRSSRMGRDKAFLDVRGTSLAEQTLRIIKDAEVAKKTTFVAGSDSQFALKALQQNAPFIFDLVPGRGPLGGLHAALSYARSDRIFVIACDLPFITAEFIHRLCEKISNVYGAVVPEQPDGRLQPLCGFYDVDIARPIVDEIIGLPRVPPPLHQIINQMKPCIVKPVEYADLSGSDRFFTNINTLDDLKAFQLLPEKRDDHTVQN
jgi:molybdopterin-guanine dinucleotide biosynthesis protein A